ncbi:hypothetical protein [Photobacterium damselae]|uniref:Uncharacterized protein n=1 Tax=Photobacterium damselae subsp. damselae TaxID=85581 RepID=A0A7Y7Q9H8_PHODD|nr:hypothetical protein [Photobacterium damselae]AWK84526.1 hypothetical protein BST98_21060 [Photobacterium damselae]KAB1179922.1 hypothetical protein F6450_12115 [Photobacterium damselae subsp. damselae]MBE8127800.1 hypothetical protein [Photobacterium damselae subsp. piscicida]MCG3823458.1 hypothetical protein [Photobacterium damselae]NVO60200.1 hypothetical protein [Photobacterium damselae subsp. damselae]
MINTFTIIQTETIQLFHTAVDFLAHYLPVAKPYFIAIMKYLQPMFTALVPTYAGYYFLMRRLEKGKIVKELKDAYQDLIFYQELEAQHVMEHKKESGKSKKNTIRDRVRNEKGLYLTANNTPGDVKRKLEKVIALDLKINKE